MAKVRAQLPSSAAATAGAAATDGGRQGPAGSGSARVAKPRWAAIGIGVVLLTLGIATFLILRPTWEDHNWRRLLEQKAQADALLTAGKPKEAYDRYKQLFATLGDHRLTRALVKGEMDVARASMEKARQAAAPIIAREEAAEREREAAARRAEEERLAQQRAEEERRRAEAEARARVVREETQRRKSEADAKMRRELSRSAVKRTSAYRELLAKARGIASDARLRHVTEDSAYRSMSLFAEADRDMLAEYVKLLARMDGGNVDAEVEGILRASDVDLLGETSAVRAVYKKDEAFVDLLGVWCRLLDGRHPGVAKAFDDERRRLRLAVAGEDSAIRAIDAHTGAAMNVLERIVTAEGNAPGAARVTEQVRTRNVGEGSAWRSAARNAEGAMELVLLLVNRDNPAAATRIRSSIIVQTATEDSALRAHARYREGTMDGLLQLITAQ